VPTPSHLVILFKDDSIGNCLKVTHRFVVVDGSVISAAVHLLRERSEIDPRPYRKIWLSSLTLTAFCFPAVQSEFARFGVIARSRKC
jgi:hypothetical protein